MPGFSIEFGNKTSIGGAGLDPGRLRETQERVVEETGAGSETGEVKTFGDFMKSLVQDSNAASLQADAKMQEVASGRNKDLHGAVLAMEKADVQFRLLTQVRNKVIEAYREVMRMQV